MRSVCMLHFKRDIQVARFLVLLSLTWTGKGWGPVLSQRLQRTWSSAVVWAIVVYVVTSTVRKYSSSQNNSLLCR